MAKVRSTVWNTRISPEQELLLDEGKQIELMVATGLLILQRNPEGVLHITFLPEDEVLAGGLRA